MIFQFETKMKFWIILVGLLVLTEAAPDDKHAKMTDFTSSLRKFTAAMYNKVARGKSANENIFFSPNSIAHTLGMVLSGASGRTAHEIMRALELERNKNYTQKNFNKLYRKVYNKLFNISRQSNSKALMASRMFVQNGYPVYEEYKETLSYYYDSESVEIDLQQAEEAANTINQWVKEQTRDNIKDLIKPDGISALTRLVLVNALYFKAEWEHKMYTEGYEAKPFHAFHSDEPVSMQFMNQYDTVRRHLDSDDLIEVAVPYKRNEAYLIIIMPKSKEAFDRFSGYGRFYPYLQRLENSFNEDWFSSKVNISIPMFEIEQEMNVKEILKSMGVQELFTDNAKLTKMAEEQLHVSTFQHKAKVTVDETGTTASAATGLTLAGRAASVPKIINIDQPFFFGIYRLGNLLFFGRFMGPETPAPSAGDIE